MSSEKAVKTTKEKTVEGPVTSVKTTTTTFKSSYESSDEPTYKSLIQPRQTVVYKSAVNQPVVSSSRYQVQRSHAGGYHSLQGPPPGAYTNITNTGITSIVTGREREKRDMQDLNERLASYIESVRFYEAQNRKLAEELERLRSKWGKETAAVKAMFQAELDEARKQLDGAEKEKARLEIRANSLEEELEEIKLKNKHLEELLRADREKYQRQFQQLSDYEAEINLLRRRLESVDSDRDKDKKEIARLTLALSSARADLDNETLNHIDSENRRQTLEEEIEFMKQIHEQELKELAMLAMRDTTSENREYWKTEMAQALREIQAAYDDKLVDMRTEMESYYNLKLQEFKTGATRQNLETVHSKEETKRLRDQLSDIRNRLGELEARNAELLRQLESKSRELEERERELEFEVQRLRGENETLREELEDVIRQLQHLVDAKLSLELEIAAYRKLLEGEESRVGLREVVTSILTKKEEHTEKEDSQVKYTVKQTEVTSGDTTTKVSQVVKGEMSAKTTYQRSAKGPVSISECGPDGKFITLENTGRKEENLGGWRITRNIDGKEQADFTLPNGFVIKPAGKVKVWAKGGKQAGAGEGDIESNQNTWGIGANINTKLINPAGEDRATHTQKTIYTS